MSHILECHEIVKTDFVRAEKCYLYDSQGKHYIDFESGIWCAALGHNHPEVCRTIEDQLRTVIHLGTRYPNQTVEKAALDVLDIVGFGQGKCTFLTSGSEAVGFAVQTVRCITGRDLLLTFSNTYLGAFGFGGKKKTDEWFLLDPQAGAETVALDGLNDIPFDRIGGFIFEPGGSSPAFGRFPPRQLVHALATRVKQAGGFVAVNEITTGMGRTGKWFGFQHYDLQPDIVSLGKGLGNGYPISAVALKPEVAAALEQSGFHYAQSHQNDPLGCAVATEVIRLFRAGNWVEQGAKTGEFFLQGLRELAARHAIVKDVRGRGLLLFLELHPHDHFSAVQAYRALLEHGFLIGYYPAANLLRFDPAMTIERADVTLLLDCLDEILKTIPA